MADAITGVAETPLQYLLRRIPRDAIYRWTTPEADRAAWQLASNSAPIGRLAHEAADRLDKAASPPPREEAPALIDTLNAASAKVALNPERAAEIRANWTNGEEAPAEGAGEEPSPEEIEPFARQWCISNGIDPDEPTPPHGEWPRWYDNAGPFAAMWKTISAALRARTSEPAREGRTHPTGEPIQDALIAGFLHGVGRSPWDDMHDYIAACARDYAKGEHLPHRTHPAPSTADKLKVAVEALKKIKGLLSLASQDLAADAVAQNNRNLAWHAADQALAAMNEQPQ